MILSASTVLALAIHCAPSTDAQTLLALSRVESGLNPFAIGRLRGAAVIQPKTRLEAIASARALIIRGESPDLGLAQINSANLARLGLSLEAAFEPCRSLGAAADLLRRDFLLARPTSANDQSALRTALSLYNSGDRGRGFRNGYVARVVAAATPRLPHPGPTPPIMSMQPRSVQARATAFVIAPEPMKELTVD